jgi:hypothetical protein
MSIRTLAAAIAFLATVAAGPLTGSAVAHGTPDDFAISYQRSGGLTGERLSLVISPGRHGVIRQGGPRGTRTFGFGVGEKRVRSLERALRRAHFADLESHASGTCADCYLHSIAYRGHRVRVIESELPPRLEPVLANLSAIIDVHSDLSAPST